MTSGTARTRRTSRVALAAGVALLVPAVSCTRGDEPRAGASRTPDVPEFTLVSDGGQAGFVAAPGVVGITGPVGIVVKQPVTILDVRPLHVDSGVELLTARAVFHGPGDRSPGGFRMTLGAPLVTCLTAGPRPGHGPSYPVAGLTLAPGDPVQFLFYLRPLGLGVAGSKGYTITYRDTAGTERTVTGGEDTTFRMDIRPPAEAKGAEASCTPKAGATWGRRLPGFPP